MDTRHITQAEISCPITAMIFFDPIIAGPCGHAFERTAIEHYLATNKNCPCCRKEIILISEVPAFFRDTLEHTLRQHDEWRKNRYFTLQLFEYEYKKKPDPDTKSRMTRIIDHLKEFPDLLNKPIAPNKSSLLYQIFLDTNENNSLELFIQYPELFSLISEKGLNYIHSSGNSPLTWLTSQTCSKKVPFSNKSFIEKINQQGLNTIAASGKDSALFWLMLSDSWVFADHPELIPLIDEKGLNTIIYEPESKCGSSALHWLIKHEYQVLRKSKYLQDLINYEGLLGLIKTNQGKAPNEWELHKPSKLRPIIESIIQKNQGLEFLIDIFNQVIQKEPPQQIIQRLKDDIQQQMAKKIDTSKKTANKTEESSDDQAESVDNEAENENIDHLENETDVQLANPTIVEIQEIARQIDPPIHSSAYAQLNTFAHTNGAAEIIVTTEPRRQL